MPERMVQRYEVIWPELFDPAVLEPTLDFLADLAGAPDVVGGDRLGGRSGGVD